MAELRRYQQTVTREGVPLRQLPHGVSLRDAVTQVDERGTICEMYDTRWDWHPEPLVYSYICTIRPGFIKGWGMHEHHDDRYFIVSGEMEVILYDERADSPTYGLVAKVVLSEYRRQLLSIPAGVWHADRNIGARDVLFVNFPTQPYDHANPDKYVLPPNNDRIPYHFDDPRGG